MDSTIDNTNKIWSQNDKFFGDLAVLQWFAVIEFKSKHIRSFQFI